MKRERTTLVGQVDNLRRVGNPPQAPGSNRRAGYHPAPRNFLQRRTHMRIFGWTVAIVVGGYSTYVFLRSVPDLFRYVKLSSL
jgi:hypothetical protein